MVDGDYRLDEFFQRYRAACPDVEPTPNFMPMLWERIEGRRGFAFTFERMARPAMTIFAALCLLLLVFRKRIRTAISSILDATDVTTANQKSVTGRSEIR